MNVTNLKIKLIESGRTLVEGLTFTLKKGDKAVIIGEEGNGKSTLLKAIYDKSSVESYAVIEGAVRADEKIGYLPQEPDFRGTVREFFHAGTAFEPAPAEKADVASDLGLSLGFFDSAQDVSTLSGGERIKIQIAKLLLERCDLLLLDEPSNDVDISALIWLEDFLSQTEMPVLFVSHDETLIENTANMIIHMEQLRRKTVFRVTVSRTDYRTYVESRLYGIQKQTQVAQKQKENFDKKVRRWREIYEKVQKDLRSCSRQNPSGGRLLKKKMHSVKAQERKNEKEKETLTALPDFEEAIKAAFPPASLPSGKVVLDLSLGTLGIGGKILSENISLKITGNAKICIVGDNGAGKTTLLKIILERLKQNPSLKIAYMPQNYLDALDTDLSPVQYLSDGTKKGETDARTLLGCMKYREEEMVCPSGSLSGGQKAKLVYLKAVLSGCNVLVLDEPTRNFSPLSTPVIRSAFSEFGGAMICVSHDRKFIDEVCGTVYRLTPDGLVLI